MPELTDGSIFLGLVFGSLSWIYANRPREPRRLPFWGAVLIGIIGAYIGPPLFSAAQELWLSIPGVPEITQGAFFIGLWVALVAITLFERKDQSRRVPVWAGVAVGFLAALLVPPLMDWLTGSYQNASLRTDVNQCSNWTPGKGTQFHVINTCDYPIVVGLCLPDEKNPEPCNQSAILVPGENAEFDHRGSGLSSLPANPNGFTVVACRPPSRPSRNLSVMARGHTGVCLPDA
ncbi:MAG: hypothetical protein ABJO09_14965 [Hyphomicrobiales bacterium]